MRRVRRGGCLNTPPARRVWRRAAARRGLTSGANVSLNTTRRGVKGAALCDIIGISVSGIFSKSPLHTTSLSSRVASDHLHHADAPCCYCCCFLPPSWRRSRAALEGTVDGPVAAPHFLYARTDSPQQTMSCWRVSASSRKTGQSAALHGRSSHWSRPASREGASPTLWRHWLE